MHGTPQRTCGDMLLSLNTQYTKTSNTKKHLNLPVRNRTRPYGTPTALPMGKSNLSARNWFHSLPFQRFHAILTLFPKSFSSFPHGTCLLSVSERYLALEENYPPFSAPRPKYATLGNRTERKRPPPARGSHPL